VAAARTRRPSTRSTTAPTVETAKIAVDSLKTAASEPPHPEGSVPGPLTVVAFVPLTNALALK
jgi:hypothetical protein